MGLTTKIYKLELMVVHHDSQSIQSIIASLESCKYVNATVMSAKAAEIESWEDSHPLNNKQTMQEAFTNLFEYNIDVGYSTYVKALDLDIDFD